MGRRRGKLREAFLAEYERLGCVAEAARRVGASKSSGYRWAGESHHASEGQGVSFAELLPSTGRRGEFGPMYVHVGAVSIEVPRTFDGAHLRDIVAALGAEAS